MNDRNQIFGRYSSILTIAMNAECTSYQNRGCPVVHANSEDMQNIISTKTLNQQFSSYSIAMFITPKVTPCYLAPSPARLLAQAVLVRENLLHHPLPPVRSFSTKVPPDPTNFTSLFFGYLGCGHSLHSKRLPGNSSFVNEEQSTKLFLAPSTYHGPASCLWFIDINYPCHKIH